MILSTFHFVASQPNGGTGENCLTSFISTDENDDDGPKWYDRPCVENDNIGLLGHKFMCEVEESNIANRKT